MSYNDLTKERVLATPKKLIPIPLIRKDSNNTVIAACTDAILSYFGYELDRKGFDWYNFLASTQEEGKGIRSAIDFLCKVRDADEDSNRLLEVSLNRYMTICDLMMDIDRDIPVICPMQAWYKGASGEYEAGHDYTEDEDYGHYVVAVGYDRDSIYFLDPLQSDTYSFIPIREFDARWHAKENGERYVRAGIQVKLNEVGRKAGYVYKIM